ncbi:thiol reductant ABC exporter subunit CydC [Marinicrinis sediminis]|uniref:Thiol reductant ABC exporter subunit CydC n=1 Tax=Marinicrinis sediminis TaxID=1652465 RepID=A0ABW5R8I6_9BACL
MNIIRELLRFIFPHKWLVALSVLFGFLTVGTNVGLMGTSGYLIASAALQPETVLLLWMPIVGVRFFGLSRGVFRYLERLASHDLTFRILARLRVWLYTGMEPHAVRLLEEHRSGDVLNSVMNDVDQMQNVYLRVLSPPVIAVLTALLGFVILGSYDLTLGLVLLAMMTLAGIAIPWWNRRATRQWGDRHVAVRSELYTETSDLIAGMGELTAYGKLDDKLNQLEATQEELSRVQRKMGGISSVSSGLMFGVSHIAMWLTLLLAIPLTASGEIGGIALPTITLVALACFEAIMPLPLAFMEWDQTVAAGRRLLRLAKGNAFADKGQEDRAPLTDQQTDQITDQTIDQQAVRRSDDPYSPSVHSELPDSERSSQTAFELTEVTYAYPQQSCPALQQVSMTIPEGAHVAIVGESGSGKSTLLQLLLKLRQHEQGEIRLNGMDIHQITEENVREGIAYMPQNPYLFHASIADNLRLAKPDATQAELEEAARQALIHDTIAALPQGYETIVGEWGTRFSGGEQQRLSLARTLLKDARIVCFDEPTTGLDPITERAFYNSMKSVLRDKTVVWVTHRLTGLREMDQIWVMNKGRVEEHGTEDVLLTRNGKYAQLWKQRQTQLHWPADSGLSASSSGNTPASSLRT